MPHYPSQPVKKTRVIGSVQRALNILDLFNDQNPELGTTEIAAALELPKSTAAGLVFTLEAVGYLDQNPENRKYRLGLKLLERGNMLLNHLDVRQVARPHLEELCNWCNETVNLAVLEGKEVVYIERLLGTSTFGIRSEIGRREPAHSTALGKAILSQRPAKQVADFLNQNALIPITPRTITSQEDFLEDLEAARQMGFAIDNEENELGGRCVAAPIFDHLGRAIASVSVSIPIQRFPESKIREYGDSVKHTSWRISEEMGYSTQPSEEKEGRP